MAEANASGMVTQVNTFGPDGLVSRHTDQYGWTHFFDPLGNVAETVDNAQRSQSALSLAIQA